MSAARGKKTKKKAGRSWARRLSVRIGFVLLALLLAWAYAGVWFVHHPRKWLDNAVARYSGLVTGPLFFIGNPVGDITDALGWTGHDAVYEYDTEAPAGAVLFAGAPRRTGHPAPRDIVILDRGEFRIGWSPSLHHPVWVAYHVAAAAPYENLKRPNFTRDRAVASAPKPSDYERSGYDRGHLAPNYAMVTRYGEAEQKKTFHMTNVAPQTPQLNRGVWRNVEHRIADLWTARYGEIWVIVGCVTPNPTGETVSGTEIEVPGAFYQVIVAQEGMDVRAQAVLFPQTVPWSAYPTRYLIAIDELEEMTGLDFLPELPDFIQSPLEAELPSRLWPIRAADIFRQIALRFM